MSFPSQKITDEMNLSFWMYSLQFFQVSVPRSSTVMGAREKLTPKMNSLYQETPEEMTYSMVFLQFSNYIETPPEKKGPKDTKIDFLRGALAQLFLTS